MVGDKLGVCWGEGGGGASEGGGGDRSERRGVHTKPCRVIVHTQGGGGGRTLDLPDAPPPQPAGLTQIQTYPVLSWSRQDMLYSRDTPYEVLNLANQMSRKLGVFRQ